MGLYVSESAVLSLLQKLRCQHVGSGTSVSLPQVFIEFGHAPHLSGDGGVTVVVCWAAAPHSESQGSFVALLSSRYTLACKLLRRSCHTKGVLKTVSLLSGCLCCLRTALIAAAAESGIEV